jgi:hypothetical protein
MYGIGVLSEPATTRSSLEEPLLPRQHSIPGDGGIVVGGGKAKPGQVASFKNAAVIRLVINRDTISASLIVSGSIDAAEDKPGYVYFVRPDEIGNNNVSYTEIPFSDMSVDNRFYPEVGDDTYEFYLVRHGQADHNILTGMGKAFSNKDTSVTAKGEEQARQSGKILSDLIQEDLRYGIPLYLFGSDLRRTRQTMIQIIKTFPALSEDSMNDGEKIIILPCAHELKYNTSSGKCDAGQGMMPTPNENISTCTRENKECISDGWVNRSYKPRYLRPGLRENVGQKQEYENDWSAYYDFYGDATRATRKWLPTCLTCAKKPAGNRCRDTDMIKEAIKSVKVEYDHRNDESTTHGSLRPSRATSFSSISRRSFDDDESDGEDDMSQRDMSQRSSMLSRYGGEDEYDSGYDSSRETIVKNPISPYNRMGGQRRRSRVRRHSTNKKTRRRHSKKKKKTRRVKKNKKTRRKRIKQ